MVLKVKGLSWIFFQDSNFLKKNFIFLIKLNKDARFLVLYLFLFSFFLCRQKFNLIQGICVVETETKFKFFTLETKEFCFFLVLNVISIILNFFKL